MHTSLTLVNIYAPNSGHIGFLTEVLEEIYPLSQPFMIIDDDFIMCMSPTKDRRTLFQSTTSTQTHKLSTSFYKIIRSHNLYDSWRVKHPTHKQYTFYSPPHKLYFHLDHFLSAPLLPHLVAAEIDPITWSDYTPILLDLTLSVPTTKTCHWRLNERLLRIPNARDQLLQKLSGYGIRDLHHMEDS